MHTHRGLPVGVSTWLGALHAHSELCAPFCDEGFAFEMVAGWPCLFVPKLMHLNIINGPICINKSSWALCVPLTCSRLA